MVSLRKCKICITLDIEDTYYGTTVRPSNLLTVDEDPWDLVFTVLLFPIFLAYLFFVLAESSSFLRRLIGKLCILLYRRYVCYSPNCMKKAAWGSFAVCEFIISFIALKTRSWSICRLTSFFYLAIIKALIKLNDLYSFLY